jgi:hypothetical protein
MFVQQLMALRLAVILCHARRDPDLKGLHRESMLAAGREMLAAIEKAAGPERADSISERIAMLLPPEADQARDGAN